MAVATGQVTIIDYNDAVTLTGFISSNRPKTQQYNPDNETYSPDWATDNVTLTPSLFILGGTNDIIGTSAVQDIIWYDGAAPTVPLVNGATYQIPESGLKTLKIKTNILASVAAKDFICQINYQDPASGLQLVYKTSISFSKVINGGGIADAVAWCPDGNIFKNGTPATIKAECYLWRGSILDSSSVEHQWYKQDGTVSTDLGGGIGWRPLSSNFNLGCSGYTTSVLTIVPGAIDNYAVFKCRIKDTQVGSNTEGDYFFDTVTVIDQSDVIQVTVESSGGNIFKNGEGETLLKARLFRAEEEIDLTGNAYNYTWYKFNKSSVKDVNFGGVGVGKKLGKEITVTTNDVDVKATFVVEVDNK